jgi:hypothetical protein
MRMVFCAAVVLGVMAVAAIPAQAARHSLDGTIKLAPIEEIGNPPFSGSADYAGRSRVRSARVQSSPTMTTAPPLRFMAGSASSMARAR